MTDLFKNLFIFEMANNHQGDAEHGLKIIRAMGDLARKHSINAAVKFQYRDIDTFIHPDFKNRDDIKHIPRFMSTRLTKDQFFSMGQQVREQGMRVVVTPFDESSVQTCLEHDVDIIKIASCSIKDWPLLEEIASSGKPVIASTGGATLQEIDRVASFFEHRRVVFAILHCVGLYPVPNSSLQMHMVGRLMRRYPQTTIGYSGHEAPDNLDPVKVAVSMGAEILERHVGVETDKIKLNKYSMTPNQTDAWISSALTVREIVGTTGDKQITEVEIESLLSLQRGVFARRAIKKGHSILQDDVFFAMPCAQEQTTSGQFGQYRRKWIASKNYGPNEPIIEQLQDGDVIRLVRSVIHEAKGMLGEANIFIGDKFEVELSHHYGMENFRETGAIIIDLINREYCKKLVLILPEQVHPNHYHKVKEETFQLLWGDMQLTLDRKTIQLKPGDIQLVERGIWHSFTSTRGAIFEEVSTTHYRNDSYYEDETIQQMDPIERKTRLEEW